MKFTLSAVRRCVCVVGIGEQVFDVNVYRLSIEPSQNCSGDSLQLFDGDTDLPLSEPICGHEPPSETFITSSSDLVVQFESNQRGADAGFVLGYTVVEAEPDEVDDDDVAVIPAPTGQRKGSQSVKLVSCVTCCQLLFVSAYRPDPKIKTSITRVM